MKNRALVVIDMQNDITKNYKSILGNVNRAIAWAVAQEYHVVYIQHNNLTEKTRTFKPNTAGAALVSDMEIVSNNLFTKTKSNALSSEAFAAFVAEHHIREFYIAGADAVACVKSTCYNMAKAHFLTTVLSDCVTSYDLRKLPEMFAYYAAKGCTVQTLQEVMDGEKQP